MPVREEEDGYWEVKSVDIDYPGQREKSNSVIRQSSKSRGLEVIKSRAYGHTE